MALPRGLLPLLPSLSSVPKSSRAEAAEAAAEAAETEAAEAGGAAALLPLPLLASRRLRGPLCQVEWCQVGIRRIDRVDEAEKLRPAGAIEGCPIESTLGEH